MAVLPLGSKLAHPAAGGTPLFRRAAPFEHLNLLILRCEILQFAEVMNPDPHF